MTLLENFKKAPGTLLLAGALSVCFSAAPSDMAVRLNSIGFIPDFPKVATVKAPGESDGTEFAVKRAEDNSVVFEGVTEPARHNADTDEFLWIADFSEVAEDGRYYVDVPAIGQRSATFRIGGDVFREPYQVLMMGMYLWRCGNPGGVSATYRGQTYSHGACHLNDGTIHSSGERKDGTGGWHDAGDYNKYVVNSGISVGMMLKAWEHFRPIVENTGLIAGPAAGGSLPPFLAEVKWNLDWVAKMQFADGSVSHKLTTENFGSMSQWPNMENTTRYFTSYSSAATASFVAMMAKAHRIYREFDPAFSTAVGNQAVKAYNFLAQNPSNVNMIGQGTTFHTGAYQTSDGDDRLWAAAEMWESTGRQDYLNDFETRARGMGAGIVRINFDWSNVQNLASMTYLFSQREGKDPELVETISRRLITNADTLLERGRNNMHGRIFGREYYWGTNGIVARNVLLLYGAYRLTGDKAYAHAAQDALSYLFGRNYYGRSFVTGLGHNPPLNPHCRRTVADGKTWPGYLIGGPHSNKSGSPPPSEGITCTLNEVCWFDDPEDYWTNEIAINWNTAMIYASAALMPGSPLREPPAGAAYRPSARPSRPAAAAAGVSRVVRVQNGRLNIPPGASVYSLDGRLVARRGLGDAAMPSIRRNGVYIIKVDSRQK